MHFKLKEIITEIAKDNNLSFEQVKQMMDSEFLATREIMKEGEHDKPDTFKNINIIKLGKIYCREGVIKRMIKMKNRKKDEDI